MRHCPGSSSFAHWGSFVVVVEPLLELEDDELELLLELLEPASAVVEVPPSSPADVDCVWVGAVVLGGAWARVAVEDVVVFLELPELLLLLEDAPTSPWFGSINWTSGTVQA